MLDIDFANLTRVDAERLALAGELVKFFLYPRRFGGTEEEADSRFLTPEAAAAKAKFDDAVGARFDDGRITGYMVRAYDVGESPVPRMIKLIATSRGVPIFVQEVSVWSAGER
ncbi:hypothetical protein J2S49_001742 [Arcanobacterium wilhelmae]|uniref:Uncharacterized protein n=1 Tax=Arcanobacterium wilhelmae TaxID=1803177 RepID=A0ABT9NEQ8_9ACTO|nr:hypothetical protein [Arcanobacterium wilhelmae]MDP9801666.1 hypothetical protein [Arcanobacterium wilhelmae]WFN90987.1 hypothetical protein P8A24_03810 [Arcanobacterium wilhelmae]